MLVSSVDIFEFERHHLLAINGIVTIEHHFLLIFRVHPKLIVDVISSHKTEELKISYGIGKLVN